jgi:hypothetical protein
LSFLLMATTALWDRFCNPTISFIMILLSIILRGREGEEETA